MEVVSGDPDTEGSRYNSETNYEQCSFATFPIPQDEEKGQDERKGHESVCMIKGQRRVKENFDPEREGTTAD
jgi:hypothetical protein